MPINLVVRAAFNPNLKTSWFSAMTQVINQITMLTVILTGAALIREREQGTVEHLLVMPIVAPEIMVAKMIANGLVILVAATLSSSSSSTGGSARRSTARCSFSYLGRRFIRWWWRRSASCSERSPRPWASLACSRFPC